MFMGPLCPEKRPLVTPTSTYTQILDFFEDSLFWRFPASDTVIYSCTNCFKKNDG